MKKFKKLFSYIFVILFMITLLPTSLFAAGSYSAGLGSTTIYVGNSTSVNINTKNAAGKFTVTSSNPAVASVSTSSVWVDGSMDTAINVKGVKAGTSVITITPTNVSDDEYNMLTGSRSVTITVKEKSSNTGTTTSKPVTKKSLDATLKSITLENGEIDFKSDVFKYTINVDKTVTSLGVKAVANDSKAKVVIEGDENFKVGTNLVTITVTAEDGTVKVYELTVIKSKFGKGPLKDLRVVGYTLDKEFDPAEYVYSVTVSKVTKVDIEYELVDPTSTVEITGNENLKVGKNIVTVKVTQKDGTVTTYKINVELTEEAEELRQHKDTAWIIAIVFLSVTLVAETVYIVYKKKENKD